MGSDQQDKLTHWVDSLIVHPGHKPGLANRDPAERPFKQLHKKDSTKLRDNTLDQISRLQYLLYADAGQSLLIVLQGLDAAGKDGTICHIANGMNPQGVKVAAFKQPTSQEASHDFLWRVHRDAPGRGEVIIFNRSHYEDVLVPRVHELVSEKVWRDRYDQINQFEALLAANDTAILKFYLHISPEEQLDRFRDRLDDPARQWKISESDYTERHFWPAYVNAYEDALTATSTKVAPWYVIPANRKWARNLAVAQIIAERLETMNLKSPPVRVNLADIRRRYLAAEKHEIKKKKVHI
ncbi:polyphosphate kinase 2 family protein [Nitrosomonas sp. HPC101]|uniref:PPK2 family polyphosphate kinase n=1 Tax=Nitrosomonas sp. HPC101 TaxID=1658667 RepID=UPI00136A2D42|nr:PPK2 family polyphosphate kinase [Nitrosomonas sp. HPC101]MXS85559.1 polyphosphate kinase 2 family protein [Nitrosomonas sp. HPC101]